MTTSSGEIHLDDSLLKVTEGIESKLLHVVKKHEELSAELEGASGLQYMKAAKELAFLQSSVDAYTAFAEKRAVLFI
jgi:hypothetical protein